jgi:hypothetical protein
MSPQEPLTRCYCTLEVAEACAGPETSCGGSAATASSLGGMLGGGDWGGRATGGCLYGASSVAFGELFFEIFSWEAYKRQIKIIGGVSTKVHDKIPGVPS